MPNSTPTNERAIDRFPLAGMLLTMWSYPYPTKYVRYVAHMEASRINRGIPSILA